LSVIVLTLNEEDNIEDALRSLLDQEGPSLEVIVVDSASGDRTVPITKGIAAGDPRVRLYTSLEHLSVGEARNIGLDEAHAERIAFMSADATAAPGWARAAVAALEDAHVAYGRQEHTPIKRSVAAAVRGMRYHHFDNADADHPETYASNVNAAIRREVFQHVRYVDDGPMSALDDILFTKEAQQLGYRVVYRDDMLVRHKDAATVREELTKNRREGLGWGLLAPRLGLNRMILIWGSALAAALVVLIAFPHIITLLLFASVLYAPTARRAIHDLRGARAAPASWLGGVSVSPFFDTAFLLSYLRGLLQSRNDRSTTHPTHGA
jgi:glycosyltransferase involved in cell wall biosynthesis